MAPENIEASIRAPVFRECISSSSFRESKEPSDAMSLICPSIMPLCPAANEILCITLNWFDELFLLIKLIDERIWKAKVRSASPARIAVASSNAT